MATSLRSSLQMRLTTSSKLQPLKKERSGSKQYSLCQRVENNRSCGAEQEYLPAAVLTKANYHQTFGLFSLNVESPKSFTFEQYQLISGLQKKGFLLNSTNFVLERSIKYTVYNIYLHLFKLVIAVQDVFTHQLVFLSPFLFRYQNS